MDAKTKAIVAHITIIGWIIALVINNSEQKDEFTSYYIRQLLGIYLGGFILSLIPALGMIISIIFIVFWVMSLIGAVQGEMKETPWIGPYFQDWFKSL
ncbi:MAG: hypothetical protein K9I29_06950 [Bacteroidales bacterium]|nr:hypothetical protein [Bacteroidales bacterium]